MKKISIVTISLLLLSYSAFGGLYRWVDDKGNVFYSDKIPPRAAKHGHIELNERGLRKKSKLSLARLKELNLIKKRKEQEHKEKQKKMKEDKLKKMQDEQLLAIYSTRDELVNVFNSKIKMSTATIKILQLRHRKLSDRLEKTEIQYEKMKNSAFKQTLEKKMDDMLDGLKVYQQAVTENIVEKDKLERRFKIDLKRYDKLVSESKLATDNVGISKALKKLKKTVVLNSNNHKIAAK